MTEMFFMFLLQWDLRSLINLISDTLLKLIISVDIYTFKLTGGNFSDSYLIHKFILLGKNLH